MYASCTEASFDFLGQSSPEPLHEVQTDQSTSKVAAHADFLTQVDASSVSDNVYALNTCFPHVSSLHSVSHIQIVSERFAADITYPGDIKRETEIHRGQSGPELIEIPEREDWGDNREYTGKASCTWDDDAETNCYFPQLDERTDEDFSSMNIWANSVGLDIDAINLGDWSFDNTESTVSDDEREFIRTAWSLLTQNLDLLKFAICWVRGDNHTPSGLNYEYFASHIAGVSGNRVEVNLFRNACNCNDSNKPWWLPSSACEAIFNFNFMGFDYDVFVSNLVLIMPVLGPALASVLIPVTSGGHIWICDMSGKHFPEMLSVWRSGPIQNKMCAAIDLACVLLHELSHVAQWSWGDKPNNCEYSYLLENTFRYCMYQRYPQALESCACAHYEEGSAAQQESGKGSLFFSPMIWWMDYSCVASSSSTSSSSSSDSRTGSTGRDGLGGGHPGDHHEEAKTRDEGDIR